MKFNNYLKNKILIPCGETKCTWGPNYDETMVQNTTHTHIVEMKRKIYYEKDFILHTSIPFRGYFLIVLLMLHFSYYEFRYPINNKLVHSMQYFLLCKSSGILK